MADSRDHILVDPPRNEFTLTNTSTGTRTQPGSSPLTATLKAQRGTNPNLFFDYQSSDPYPNVREIELKVDSTDANRPVLVLKWATPANPNFFVSATDLPHTRVDDANGQLTRFTFELPPGGQTRVSDLVGTLPTYELKVKVKRQ